VRHRTPLATYPNPTRAAPKDPYLVLLQVGFTLPFTLPQTRCALTAPFHPYRRKAQRPARRRYVFCGTFRRLAPPRCYLAPCPVEPGLSSAPYHLLPRRG